jgi:hypothetical protein
MMFCNLVFCKQGHGVVSHRPRPSSESRARNMVKSPFENEVGKSAEI